MSAATFISRILGFIRDMIFAFYFGATGISDTFFQAFKIPNLLRELLAEGSMSSAFVPVLTEYRQKQGEEEAVRLVRITFTFILVVVGLICVLGIIFSPAIVTVVSPGFVKSPEKFSMTVLLTRIMFPFLLCVSLAALLMGALNTKKVFFVPALAPAMLNITLILSIVFFESRTSQPIIAAAIGVLAGGFVQFAFQLPSFFKNGYRLGLNPSFRHPGIRKMTLLLVPATLALSVSQINIIVSSIFASFLPQGSITYLFYSMRLVQFPIGIFGVAMGMAVLPTLSEHAVKGDMEKLREDFSFALRLAVFYSCTLHGRPDRTESSRLSIFSFSMASSGMRRHRELLRRFCFIRSASGLLSVFGLSQLPFIQCRTPGCPLRSRQWACSQTYSAVLS